MSISVCSPHTVQQWGWVVEAQATWAVQFPLWTHTNTVLSIHFVFPLLSIADALPNMALPAFWVILSRSVILFSLSFCFTLSLSI